MCQYSSGDGFASDWHLVHLGSRAVGGAAAVLTEATAVTPEGRISPDDLGIWKDAHVEMLARIFRFAAEHGAAPGMQLSHAGRKASTRSPFKGGGPLSVADGGWTPIVGPSAIPFADGYQTPAELDLDGIHTIVDAFSAAARRVLAAGGRIIEVHGAHGYLLHEFLSPLSNRRTDGYGGSFDGRIRLALRGRRGHSHRVAGESAVARPDLGDRLDRWRRGRSRTRSRWRRGWRQWASTRLTVPPAATYRVRRSRSGPATRSPFADELRKSGVVTAAVGMITSAEQAEHILRTGQADLIVMARALLKDPVLAVARRAHARAHTGRPAAVSARVLVPASAPLVRSP